MPTSINPLPKDDEVECGNCGAYIYHDLLKCPNCGVYLVNPFPHIDLNEQPSPRPKNRIALWVESLMRKLRGEPHVADELFIGIMEQKELYDDLLRKVGGDVSVVDRLIEYEKQLSPSATRLICLQNAIRRWERENR
jgi:hypothetical protein